MLCCRRRHGAAWRSAASSSSTSSSTCPRYRATNGQQAAATALTSAPAVAQDLVISSTPGIIISAAGTLLLLVLFVFQLKDYLAIGSETTLVVDELVDDTLRVNFNVTLHEARRASGPPTSPPRTGPPGSDEVAVPVPAYRTTRPSSPGHPRPSQVPCEYLAVDVSDLTGIVRHNISKDILKWRLNARQAVLGDSMAVAVKEAKAEDASRHENHDVFFDDEDAPEPADPAWSKCRPGGAAARCPGLPGRALQAPGCARHSGVGR